MRKIVLATAFVLTSSAAFAAPFSAQVGGESAYNVGGFRTLAQCQAYVSGVGGTCIDNGSSWTNAQARFLEPVKTQPIMIDGYNLNQP